MALLSVQQCVVWRLVYDVFINVYLNQQQTKRRRVAPLCMQQNVDVLELYVFTACVS